jgi:hypothetical protein
MTDIEKYRNISWDNETLDEFIKDDFIEGRNGEIIIEYKQGEFLTFKK